jgi:hypothetical protein
VAVWVVLGLKPKRKKKIVDAIPTTGKPVGRILV